MTKVLTDEDLEAGVVDLVDPPPEVIDPADAPAAVDESEPTAEQLLETLREQRGDCALAAVEAVDADERAEAERLLRDTEASIAELEAVGTRRAAIVEARERRRIRQEAEALAERRAAVARRLRDLDQRQHARLTAVDMAISHLREEVNTLLNLTVEEASAVAEWQSFTSRQLRSPRVVIKARLEAVLTDMFADILSDAVRPTHPFRGQSLVNIVPSLVASVGAEASDRG